LTGRKEGSDFLLHDQFLNPELCKELNPLSASALEPHVLAGGPKGRRQGEVAGLLVLPYVLE